jgi:ABC-type uncharacterized transport system substrate-binding protein
MSKYPKWLRLSLLAFVLVVAGALAEAQQPAKIPRIGFLTNTKLDNPSIEPFRRGLQALGYAEGKNISIEYRYYETKRELIPPLVAELVQMNVDVLVVGAPPAIRAARQVTKTIPIVMVTNQVRRGRLRRQSCPPGWKHDRGYQPHPRVERQTVGIAERDCPAAFPRRDPLEY